MAVLTGLDLPPALICTIADRAIPLVLADVHLTPKARKPWRWPRRMAFSLLDRFDLILARDLDSIRVMHTLISSGLNIEMTGRLEETTEALPHSESERNALAELLRTRPVWLAAACPPTEEAAVVAAHSRAMRYAHRILLILAPSEPSRGSALAETLQVAGLNVARRSQDQEPEDDVQVFIADTDDEMGLWYRLAPVTYMGGTLVEGGAGRNPMEPAALGSAIVHGPQFGPYPEAYARLADAFAARRVASGPDLADAITDLIAPDKAAFLAHNAWAAASGGAEVTERVMRLLFGLLAAGSDAPAPKAMAGGKTRAAGKGAG